MLVASKNRKNIQLIKERKHSNGIANQNCSLEEITKRVEYNAHTTKLPLEDSNINISIETENINIRCGLIELSDEKPTVSAGKDESCSNVSDLDNNIIDGEMIPKPIDSHMKSQVLNLNVLAWDHTYAKHRKTREKRPSDLHRFDGFEHNIRKSDTRQRCKNESCIFKSYMMCEKCDVHLCSNDKRKCFDIFHILQ